jgi:hypothetical protein
MRKWSLIAVLALLQSFPALAADIGGRLESVRFTLKSQGGSHDDEGLGAFRSLRNAVGFGHPVFGQC